MNDGGSVHHPNDSTLASLLKALAHPVRLRILRHLIQTGGCVCVQILPLAQSTVSQHLKILKDSGLVKGEIEGPRTRYRLDPDTLETLRQAVLDLCAACRPPDKTPKREHDDNG